LDNIKKSKTMKKVIFTAALGTILLASCGGKTTACDCAQGLKDMMKDYTEAAGDQAKLDGLEKKYEQLGIDCEALSEEMGQEEFNKAVEGCN